MRIDAPNCLPRRPLLGNRVNRGNLLVYLTCYSLSVILRDYGGFSVGAWVAMFSRIAALPLLAKVLLAFAALIALGLSIVLSPLMSFVAVIVLSENFA